MERSATGALKSVVFVLYLTDGDGVCGSAVVRGGAVCVGVFCITLLVMVSVVVLLSWVVLLSGLVLFVFFSTKVIGAAVTGVSSFV